MAVILLLAEISNCKYKDQVKFFNEI